MVVYIGKLYLPYRTGGEGGARSGFRDITARVQG